MREAYQSKFLTSNPLVNLNPNFKELVLHHTYMQENKTNKLLMNQNTDNVAKEIFYFIVGVVDVVIHGPNKSAE